MQGRAQQIDVCLVVGGADRVWQDLAKAENQFNITRYFITNTIIAYLDRPGIGVTLHPDLLAKWLPMRQTKALPELDIIFTHRPYNGCTVFQPAWRGSVSLFAVEIAHRHFGHERIMLAGCPMTIQGGHFERKKLWGEALRFRKGWIENKQSIAPYVRSLSGWTQEQFGSEFN